MSFVLTLLPFLLCPDKLPLRPRERELGRSFTAAESVVESLKLTVLLFRLCATLSSCLDDGIFHVTFDGVPGREDTDIG